LTDVFSASPYRKQLQALAVTATESISAGASDQSGIGVVCKRGSGASRVQYEFLLKTSGQWVIYLRTGAISMSTFPQQIRVDTPGSPPVRRRFHCRPGASRSTTRHHAVGIAIDG